MVTPKYPAVFYNIGPIGENKRGPAVLGKELRAITSQHPAVIGLCETVGWGDMPDLAEYVCVRDRSNDSSANITAYVRRGLSVTSGWHLMTKTWKRTEHPGQHAPRAVLELRIDDTLWFITHQAPRTKYHDTDPAKWEVIDFLTPRMAPWERDDWKARADEAKSRSLRRLRVVLWDPNHDPDADGPGPKTLAHRCGGWKEGTAIEGGVGRGGRASNPRKQASVAGVKLGSDHHGAFFMTALD